MMALKRRVTACAALIAALGVGAAAGSASATTNPYADAVITGPSCPDGYTGPTNLATGCPWWIMSYTVAVPGRSPRRMPPGWTPPAPR
jgi:hypothetical protein